MGSLDDHDKKKAKIGRRNRRLCSSAGAGAGKVYTSKGLRARRLRLSAPTAINFTIFKIALDVADQLKPSIGFFRMRNPPLMPSLDLYKQRTTIAENRFSVYLFLHLLLLRSSSLTHFKISPKRATSLFSVQ
uniref:Uncharacterized protein n=1 Tax=Cucumis melo TaxID=3656 RepID=A0A9I9CF38_CUCME